MVGARTMTVMPPVSRPVAVQEPERSRGGAKRVAYEESLAAVAHELRGPLATILFALETISDRGAVDPAVRRAREIAERQAMRASRIVDDLFDICAGSFGKLSLRKRLVNVAEVVGVAAETVAHLLSDRRLTFSLPSRPLFVVADPLRLEQVLTNLLANAAKFTDRGGHIHLAAEAEDEQVVLRVRDDGRGIAPHLLSQVFNLFTQGCGSGERAGGLGLGLALVKSLVELHDGCVVVASGGIGQGAEFAVRLPAHAWDA